VRKEKKKPKVGKMHKISKKIWYVGRLAVTDLQSESVEKSHSPKTTDRVGIGCNVFIQVII